MLRQYSLTALILAPHGRDAQIAAHMLAEASATTEICTSLDALVDGLDNDAGFALIAEEALVRADLRRLKQWIEAQPEWSDFPFILITSRGGGLERNPAAGRYLETLGNVTFIERRSIRPRSSASPRRHCGADAGNSTPGPGWKPWSRAKPVSGLWPTAHPRRCG